MLRTILPLALLLAGCGVEQSQPAPDIDAENWGHLAADPDRPQQAEASVPAVRDPAPPA